MRATDASVMRGHAANGATKVAGRSVGVIENGASAERWLSIKQFAAMLGVSRQTAYKWAARHDGRSFPRSIRLPNGSVRVREDWFQAWLATLERHRLLVS